MVIRIETVVWICVDSVTDMKFTTFSVEPDARNTLPDSTMVSTCRNMQDASPAVSDSVFRVDIEWQVPFLLHSGNDTEKFPFNKFEATWNWTNNIAQYHTFQIKYLPYYTLWIGLLDSKFFINVARWIGRLQFKIQSLSYILEQV